MLRKFSTDSKAPGILMEKPAAPRYLLHAPVLVRTALCLVHYIRNIEYGISPDGRLRFWGKLFVYLSALGGMATILIAAGLYAALCLAGIALAVAGLILGVAEALLAAVVALLAAWVVGKVLGRLIAEDWKKRTRRP